MRPDSLLRIPLVKIMLSDPHFEVHRRAIDCDWYYQKAIPASIGGFNPTVGQAFIGSNSRFSEWLKNKGASPREFNMEDRLISEVFFAVHDYLHNWAYRLINLLYPKLGFGVAKVTSKNIETFAFCHILTEAVATIGLDYWYLSTVDLNEVIPIGTTRGPLTANFHEKHMKEYLRFHPRLKVQDPLFFKQMTRFYCSGVLFGFVLKDLMQSPLVFSWLYHEISYGELQRRYSRKWLIHLAGNLEMKTDQKLDRRITISQPWQKNLIEQTSIALWNLVKHGKQLSLPPLRQSGRPWTSKKTARVSDPCFFNINSLGEDFWDPILEADFTKSQVPYLFRQIVSKYRHSEIHPDDLKLLANQADDPDFKMVKHILRSYKPMKVRATEPSDIFFLS